MKNLVPNKILIEEIENGSSLEISSLFSFKIVWANQKDCLLLVNDKSLILKKGEFIILMPENNIKISPTNKGTITYLSFSIDYLQLDAHAFSIDIFKLFIKRIGNNIIKINEESFYNIEILKSLLFKYKNSNTFETEISLNLFNSIILILVNNNHDFVSLPDKYYHRIHDFFLLVFDKSKSEKRVSYYAEKLNISSKRLNQILNEFTNKSASYFIQEHLIMEAKRRLLYSNMNINEIAEELGFDDVGYFSRFFKRWEQTSPERFRKKILQK